MICLNCNTKNIEEAKFCAKCGSILEKKQNNMQEYNNEQQIMGNAQSSVYVENNPSINLTNQNISDKVSIKEYFFIVLAVILKPFTAFKEEINRFNNIKNSAILAVIISALATLLTLLKTMYSVVRVQSLLTKEVKWVWENLKEINYIQSIGKTFIIYLGIILAIACVYYIGGLIIKKQPNFAKLLGISATSLAPLIICSMILSPLLGLIYAPLGTGISIVGGVYAIIIIYETINNEILIDGDLKFYFNLVCLALLTIAAYYLYMKIFMSTVTTNVDNLLDMFNY